LVLPIIEENRALAREADELQLQINRLQGAQQRLNAPLEFWSVHLGVYLLAPIALLLSFHAIITIVLNAPLLYLRLGSIAIPLPFGLALRIFSHHGVRWSALYGIVVAVIGVAAMLTLVGYIDQVSILPEDAREWREASEYAASIMLAYITGNVLGALVQRMLPRTLDASGAPSPLVMHAVRIVGGSASKQVLRRRAQKVSDNLSTAGMALGALGTAGASIYSGLRALFGGG
jgi:hypothetical protein